MKIKEIRIKTREEGYEGSYLGETFGGQGIVRWEESEHDAKGNVTEYRCFVTTESGEEDYGYYETKQLVITYELEQFSTRPRTISDKCHSDIRTALQDNLEIKCMVWDNYPSAKEEAWVVDYIPKPGSYPYKTTDNRYTHAEPIKKTAKKTFLKKASELIKHFEENEYMVDSDGDWVHSLKKNFNTSYFQHCGKELPEGTAWPSVWVEIRTESK